MVKMEADGHLQTFSPTSSPAKASDLLKNAQFSRVLPKDSSKSLISVFTLLNAM
jgi:hypothetical protein